MPKQLDDPRRAQFAQAAKQTPPRWALEQDSDERTASLHLYGVIGGWWGDIDASAVVPAIRDLDVDHLAVYVNSPGGDVYDSVAIRNALRQHDARVTITIDGLAASGGSVIATAGDEVVMGDGAEIMIHDAWTIGIGNAEDMRAVADDLDRVSDNIAAMYAKRAGGKAADWRTLMKAETWYSADEAVAAGLADRLDTDDSDDEDHEEPAVAALFDLSMYTHAGRAAAQAPIPVAALAAHRKEHTMPEAQTAEADARFAEITTQLNDVQRSLAVINDRGAISAEPDQDTRSAGEWLRDLARNDTDTVAAYEGLVASAYPSERPRAAYEGGTSADGILTPQWVGDTIRLIEAPNYLGRFFSTGQLPSKGLQLEYGVLVSDSVDVAEQVNEGDDLTKGKIVVDVEHEDIKTFGGYVELTRQQIERTTNVNVLNLHLRALAGRAGRRKATVLRALYNSVWTENSALANQVVVVSDLSDYKKWLAAITNAAAMFADQGLALDGLVLDTTTFLGIGDMAGTDGRSLLKIDGGGEAVNTVGQIAPRTITGSLMGVPFVVDPKLAANTPAFASSEAIRQYNGSITELADENIVNLSKRFGVYYYAANAAEIPEGVVPVVDSTPDES